MIQDNPAPVYCSDLSIQAGEPLIGSATPTNRYLLLEYNQPWGAKALEESEIPAEVRTQIDGFTRSDKKTKALLIHRAHQSRSHKLQFFLASTTPRRQGIFAFEIDRYEELLQLDLNEVFSEPDRYRSHRREQPLLLVCANGRRDRCCARHGIPVFNVLQAGNEKKPLPLVWQCTHLGGHRFAANVLVLPHGLLYGRVDPDSAAQILQSTFSQSIYLPNLRGRTDYPAPAQVADHYLRQQTGEVALDAFEFIGLQQAGEAAWEVAFRRFENDRIFRLKVQAQESPSKVYESCQLDKSTPLVCHTVKII